MTEENNPLIQPEIQADPGPDIPPPAKTSKTKRKKLTLYQKSRFTQKDQKHKKIDAGKALTLKAKGLSYRDIAKHFNVTEGAVFQSIKKVERTLLSVDDTNKYNQLEDRLLTSGKYRIIQHALNPDVLKKASFLQATTGYCQLFDKHRLLTGQSTSNNMLSVLIRSAHDPKQVVQELKENKDIRADLTVCTLSDKCG